MIWQRGGDRKFEHTVALRKRLRPLQKRKYFLHQKLRDTKLSENQHQHYDMLLNLVVQQIELEKNKFYSKFKPVLC